MNASFLLLGLRYVVIRSSVYLVESVVPAHGRNVRMKLVHVEVDRVLSGKDRHRG
jgi:hypothetical protein